MRSDALSIRSLAQGLGLSRTTVSDALRGASGVSPQTMQRVQKAAAAAGYKSNPLESAVMSQLRRTRGTQRFGMLAAVDLDESDRPPTARQFHQALIEGARRRAGELGFDLQVFLVGQHGVTVHRLDVILQSRGIKGVLLLPAWHEPDFSKLDWSRFVGVYTDYVIQHPALHSVCADHYRALIGLLGRLQQLGYRRPGLFVQQHSDERLHFRWVGALSGYQRAHPEIARVPALVFEKFEPARFTAWFRRYRPDVVLGHIPEAIDLMQAAGARVPETHGFVCLNLLPEGRECAGLDLQPRLLGERGIELLIAQLQRNERGIPDYPLVTMVPTRWVDGPTLRAIAKPSR
jgi:LacI family transcriptional regulator